MGSPLARSIVGAAQLFRRGDRSRLHQPKVTINLDFPNTCVQNPKAIYVLACLQLPARSRAIATESSTTLRLFAPAPELRADRASSVFDVAA